MIFPLKKYNQGRYVQKHFVLSEHFHVKKREAFFAEWSLNEGVVLEKRTELQTH